MPMPKSQRNLLTLWPKLNEWMKNRLFLAVLLLLASVSPVFAQYTWQELDRGDTERPHPLSDMRYKVELQGSLSKGKTPLWLNANRYGLSSLDEANGYVRAAVERPLAADSARRWGVGYGVDVAAASHYTSRAVVQQAWVEARWLHGALTVGARQYPMELKSNSLSSGSQTLGINARPVPQARLALPEYWTIPALGRWLHLKGHVAYGMTTDDSWQKRFTRQHSRFTRHALYHSKAGYLMIGKPEAFYPLYLELGLEMAAQFGGATYKPDADGNLVARKAGHGLKDFWHAFFPGGQDATDGAYGNVEGNQLGSWVGRLTYDADTWRAAIYWDHYFEDHSQMLLLDYDGYGEGDEYMQKKRHRFFLYSLKDIMLGGELRLRQGRWLRGVVAEYLHTRYQSGPVYHDRTSAIPDHIAGRDNYYNHNNYTGWQHWGQVMGNPLYRSPIYNDDGRLRVEDNRFVAWHIGFEGQPTERLGYRVLATWQRGYGAYDQPYPHVRHNRSLMAEAAYSLPRGWTVRAAAGIDCGSILGHNRGLQLTITKEGTL